MFLRSSADIHRCLIRTVKTDASKNPKWGTMPRSVPQARVLKSLDGSASEQARGGKDKPFREKTPMEYVKHRQRLKERFPDGWNPPRKLSREAMDGLRTLHAHDPRTFTTPVLAERFRISPEAVRRILKSDWVPKKEEKAKLIERERRRKGEFIAKRIERERTETEQIDNEERQDERRAKDDGFTFV